MATDCILLGCLQETQDTVIQMVRLGEKPDRIVCISEEEAKRQSVTNFADMRPLADSLKIPWTVLNSYSIKDEQDVEFFRNLKPQIMLVVGWQRLVPDSVLEHIQLGTIGFHGSCNILPWGRGRSPINWSIIEGRDRFALHMFFIKPGIDDGDIIGIKIYDINLWDNCRTVYYKTSIAQAELIAGYLPLIRAGQCPRMPQHGTAFYYPKRTPKEGRISWNADTETICRLVRAVTWPYPGAFTYLGGEEVKIWNAQPFSRDFFESAPPGEVCFVGPESTGEFIVRCADGTVLITDVESSVPIKLGDKLE